MRARYILPLAALAGLSACGSGGTAPGGISPEEDRQLNEAASGLDANFMTTPDNGTTDAPSDQGNSQ
ncbi:MAG: hypothetical protein V4459_09630 [Pseudomonadota bacterium]